MFLNFDEFALLFIILLLLFSFLRLCWPPFDQKTDTEFRKAFMFFKKSELAKELNFQVIIFSVTPTLPGYLRLLLCI